MKTNSLSFKSFIMKTCRQSLVFIIIAVIVGMGVNLVHPRAVMLPGDWSIDAQLTLENGERIDISLRDARKLFESGKGIFLDARPYNQFEQGRIKGAKSFPLDEFDIQFEKVVMNLEDDTPMVTYCDGESCHLSKDLAVALKELGFTNVRVLVNGWTVWQDAGLPVETEG